MPDIDRSQIAGAGGLYHAPSGNTLWNIKPDRELERSISATEHLPDVFYETTDSSPSSPPPPKSPSPEPSAVLEMSVPEMSAPGMSAPEPSAFELSALHIEPDSSNLPRAPTPSQPMNPQPLAVIERSFLQILFRCSLDGCKAECTDSDPDTMFCNGCGPCSPVRYCRLTHLLADACVKHHKLCGLTYFNIPVALSTLPSRYLHNGHFPTIQSLPKHSCYELQRQRSWSMYCHDKTDYAIFSDFRDAKLLGKVSLARSQIPTHHIVWNSADPRKDIFNRCLNLGFLDCRLLPPLILLYRLLREALIQGGQWRLLEGELQSQIYQEFAVDMYFVAPTGPLNLAREWSGAGGVEAICERLEAKYAVLRIWRREHPQLPGVENTLARYRNDGGLFPGCQVGGVPPDALWGPAWDGWKPYFTTATDAGARTGEERERDNEGGREIKRDGLAAGWPRAAAASGGEEECSGSEREVFPGGWPGDSSPAASSGEREGSNEEVREVYPGGWPGDGSNASSVNGGEDTSAGLPPTTLSAACEKGGNTSAIPRLRTRRTW
ncbi:MAG: hypothetical protein M1829_006241 [Trizodia sp. TS-e1964]|nr:MAG: hypothetical protein M1829_006241 [Trizodia sp. TS-e1964]